jgi:hypothetical protein
VSGPLRARGHAHRALRWRTANPAGGDVFRGEVVGYALVAAAVIVAGELFGSAGGINPVFEGAVMIVLALVLLQYGLKMRKAECAECDHDGGREAFGSFKKNGVVFAAQSGFLTGLGYCAPMMTLIVSGLVGGSAAGAALSFAGFFAGTSAILLPLFVFGYAAGNRPIVTKIGFFCALAASALYFFQGILTIVISEV